MVVGGRRSARAGQPAAGHPAGARCTRPGACGTRSPRAGTCAAPRSPAARCAAAGSPSPVRTWPPTRPSARPRPPMWKAALAAVEGPVIAAGDLNEGPGGSAWRMVEDGLVTSPARRRRRSRPRCPGPAARRHLRLARHHDREVRGASTTDRARAGQRPPAGPGRAFRCLPRKGPEIWQDSLACTTYPRHRRPARRGLRHRRGRQRAGRGQEPARARLRRRLLRARDLGRRRLELAARPQPGVRRART